MRIALLLALLALVAPASASAHAGQTGGTDYRSTVTSTPGGMHARMVGGDDRLEVVRTTAREVIVLGYGGEPYVRLDARGVWENRNSPAVALNDTRHAEPTGGAGGPPRWVRIGGGDSIVFHDHRAHWMGSQPPAAVRADPRRSRVLYDWSVPVRVDGRDAAIRGDLAWVAPPATWLWWTLAAFAVALAVVAGLVLRVAAAAPLGIAGMLTAAGAAITTGLAQQSDVPDGGTAAFVGLAIGVALVAAGLFLGHRLRAQPPQALTVLLLVTLIAGVIPLVGFASAAFAYAVVPGALPATATRALIVIGLAGVGLTTGACARAWRDALSGASRAGADAW